MSTVGVRVYIEKAHNGISYAASLEEDGREIKGFHDLNNIEAVEVRIDVLCRFSRERYGIWPPISDETGEMKTTNIA